MKRKLLYLAWLLMPVVCAHAQGPNGTLKYYKMANGMAGEELKTAFYYIIRDPSVMNYSGL
ncbi:MAG: nuclease, partial [Prevotella sp.]|nr:nuclease [Prevotella sp.]